VEAREAVDGVFFLSAFQLYFDRFTEGQEEEGREQRRVVFGGQ